VEDQMAETRDLIRKLSKAMPIADAEQQRRQAATRAIQMQRTVAQAPTVPATQIAPVAGFIGVQQQQLAGQQAVQNAQQQSQRNIGLQQAAVGAQGIAQQSQIAGQALAQQEQANKAQIATQEKARQAEDQIFQNQLSFNKDELGRKFLQGTQELDAALISAKSAEDFKDKAQYIQHVSDQKIQMLTALNKRLSLIIKGEAAIGEQKLDQASKERIQAYQQQIEAEIQRSTSAAANREAMFTAGGGVIGGVVGGVIGAVYGGGGGAVPGAVIGAGAGSQVGKGAANS
jgi:hypothetical protein